MVSQTRVDGKLPLLVILTLIAVMVVQAANATPLEGQSEPVTKEACTVCGHVYSDPMTEEDVEDELATIQFVQCCCIQNITDPTYSNDTLVDDFSCCGEFSLLCDTRTRNVATNPYAASFEGSQNKRDPNTQELELGDPIFDSYAEVYCACTPSWYNTTCSISAWGDVFRSFVCEGC